ncbi:hypothetical protein CEXT_721671 [Caerostris extrusa]|uniref:Uncharacterized protein n=1 Tax=Caerostris extrusa TaxID=172846 RepID=A0AAV4T621_CAEEX|nr:hypothetical protein CEXT_721671 [Caerostris extrusa]
MVYFDNKTPRVGPEIGPYRFIRDHDTTCQTRGTTDRWLRPRGSSISSVSLTTRMNRGYFFWFIFDHLPRFLFSHFLFLSESWMSVCAALISRQDNLKTNKL